MMRGPTLVALAIAATPLASPPAANAELRWHRCAGEGHQCAGLAVPLDRTGAVPGSVILNVVRSHDQNRRNRVVSFDARGTGKSGLLRCRALERAPLANAARAAAACGRLAGQPVRVRLHFRSRLLNGIVGGAAR
jgi:hypothetical protein